MKNEMKIIMIIMNNDEGRKENDNEWNKWWIMK